MKDQALTQRGHDHEPVAKPDFGTLCQRFHHGEFACKINFAHSAQFDQLSISLPELRAGIAFEHVPHASTAVITELLQERSNLNNTEILGTLNKILEVAKNYGAHFRSKLGNDTTTIIANLRQLLDSKKDKVINSSKAHIEYRDLNIGELGTQIRWVNVINSNESSLHSIANYFNIDYTDLKRVIKNKHVPSSYRYDRYLFVCLDELLLNNSELTQHVQLNKQEIYAIMSDGFLITFCKQPSSIIKHVWTELEKRPSILTKIKSTAHLFSRILGAALHTNEERFTCFKEYCQTFFSKHSDHIPRRLVREQLNDINQSLRLVLEAIQRVPVTIAALREQRNFFGADQPADSLERYSGIRHGLEHEIEATRMEVRDMRETWETNMEHRKNDILAKIAYLGGLTAIPSMIADILGIGSISKGVIVAVVASFAVAITLVGHLFYKDLKNKQHNLST